MTEKRSRPRRLAKFALIWLAVVTAAEAQGPEPSRAGARARADRGDICIVERARGEVRGLARDVVTEDAHRVACQQWLAGGEQVVFHDLRNEQWLVISVVVRSGTQGVLIRGRQLG